MGISNDVIWSKTRMDSFNFCLRSYWYQYYGSWNGWRKTSPEHTREIYLLKKLSSRWKWVGEAVHTTIAEILTQFLEKDQAVPKEEAIERVKDSLRKTWRESKDKLYLSNNKCLGLFEHEYEVEVPSGAWKAMFDLAIKCMDNFYQLPLYEEIMSSNPNRWYPIDTPQRASLDSVPAWFTPDFAFISKGRCKIIDWKTGKDDGETGKAKDQLVIYSTFANTKWGHPLDKIDLLEVRLVTPRVISYTPPETSDKYISNIKKDYEKLVKFHSKVEGKDLPLEECPPSPTPDCKWCNYRKLCERNKLLVGIV